MCIAVGIDIAREVHWVTAINEAGDAELDCRVENTPADLAVTVDELTALEGMLTIKRFRFSV